MKLLLFILPFFVSLTNLALSGGGQSTESDAPSSGTSTPTPPEAQPATPQGQAAGSGASQNTQGTTTQKGQGTASGGAAKPALTKAQTPPAEGEKKTPISVGGTTAVKRTQPGVKQEQKPLLDHESDSDDDEDKSSFVTASVYSGLALLTLYTIL